MRQWGPDVFRADQDAALTVFMQRNLACSTIRTYASGVSQYEEFCRLLGVPGRPDASILAKLVMYRSQHGYKLSSVESLVSAVGEWSERVFGMRGRTEGLLVRGAVRGASHEK